MTTNDPSKVIETTNNTTQLTGLGPAFTNQIAMKAVIWFSLIFENDHENILSFVSVFHSIVSYNSSL